MLPHVLHDIEKKIIAELQRGPAASTPQQLGERAGLSADQVRRGVEWLRLKGMASVEEDAETVVRLGGNGLEALERGLPERRLLDLVRGGERRIPELQRLLGPLFGTAVGSAKRGGWIRAGGSGISLVGYPGRLPEERLLALIGRGRIPLADVPDPGPYALLRGRPDYVVEEEVGSRTVRLAGPARDMAVDRPEGGGGAIDVEAAVPPAFAARRHPLKETIDEIREVFVALGFSEVSGSLSQPGFWNFDALFTPQDHPARDMQDTFYLDTGAGGRRRRVGTDRQIRGVSESHERNWRYAWSVREAERTVLRTHTTCVTIRHLADAGRERGGGESRVFSLGRVFRNEKASYKHLVEFHQVEGVVAGRGSTLRDLMGIQKEFYRRMGLPKVKFWPTFFPYTEPSLQTMVYNERLGRWVELFGMGIFRPEVTGPLGIEGPVLAWGGGIERIAMMRYGLDDVREFYNNDLGWLRNVPKCR